MNNKTSLYAIGEMIAAQNHWFQREQIRQVCKLEWFLAVMKHTTDQSSEDITTRIVILMREGYNLDGAIERVELECKGISIFRLEPLDLTEESHGQ